MSIPDSHLKSIGKLAVNFQFIETVLVFYLCNLINPNQAVGHIVATQLPFGRLCIVVRALFEIRYTEKELRERLSDLLTKAGQLEEKRNQYFHSVWGVDDDSGSPMRIKMKVSRSGKLTTASPNVNDSELNDVNEALRECGKALLQLGSDSKLFNVGSH